MDEILTKCFICDEPFVANQTSTGQFLSDSLNTPIKLVLQNCLRVIIEVEKEYFCTKCSTKIYEYDKLVQMCALIEDDLYGLFQKKPLDTYLLLDAEILDDSATDTVTPTKSNELQSPGETALNSSNSDFDQNLYEIDYVTENEEAHSDEMVVEYLEDCDSQPLEEIEDYVAAHVIPTKEKCKDSIDMLKLEVKEEVIDDDGDGAEEQEIPKQKPKTKSPTKSPKKSPLKSPKTEKVKTTRKSIKVTVLSCKKCSFTCQTIPDLRAHAKTHTDSPFVCDLCGRSYKTKSALTVHVGVHAGRDPFECPVCKKKFTQNGALSRHMPLHTGEKPYQCHVCGKRFIHYSSFHMHQMIHNNVRTKKCTVCGLELRSTSHLQRHMRIHTGEKPYACEICGQKFAQRYNMKSHFNTHQGIHRVHHKKHKCCFCREAYSRPQRLHKHFRDRHHLTDEEINAIEENGENNEYLARLKTHVVVPKEEISLNFIDEENDQFGDSLN